MLRAETRSRSPALTLGARADSVGAGAVIVWLGIMLLAFANGALREMVLSPRLGSETGHVISTLLLTAAIVLAAWLSIRWIGPLQFRSALRVGVIWLAMTLAFEFLVGHFVFRTPWPVILAEYDILSGRIWLLVPLATLIAPVWAWVRRCT